MEMAMRKHRQTTDAPQRAARVSVDLKEVCRVQVKSSAMPQVLRQWLGGR